MTDENKDRPRNSPKNQRVLTPAEDAARREPPEIQVAEDPLDAYLDLPELDFFYAAEREFLIQCVLTGADRRNQKVILAARIWEQECTGDDVKALQRVFRIENGCMINKPRGEGKGTKLKRGPEHYDAANQALTRVRLAESHSFAKDCGDTRRMVMHEMAWIALDRRNFETKDRISAAKAVASLAGSRDELEEAQLTAHQGRVDLPSLLEQGIKNASKKPDESDNE